MPNDTKKRCLSRAVDALKCFCSQQSMTINCISTTACYCLRLPTTSHLDRKAHKFATAATPRTRRSGDKEPTTSNDLFFLFTSHHMRFTSIVKSKWSRILHVVPIRICQLTEIVPIYWIILKLFLRYLCTSRSYLSKTQNCFGPLCTTQTTRWGGQPIESS